jgi:uncharacterized membrane protein YcaP (DUF421 family)
MLFGDWPPLFMLEIVLRTVVIYAYTLLLVRLVGKRGMGQLSPFDFVIVIALGSAVGDPMFYQEVPLVHTMLVITVVVALQRTLGAVTERSGRISRFIESEPSLLVNDGVIDRRALHQEQLECEELLASLRIHGIKQLGEVERAYIETSGHISVLRHEAPIPGRPLIPPQDPGYPSTFQPKQPAPHQGLFSCVACGQGLALEAHDHFPGLCARCGEPGRWMAAVPLSGAGASSSVLAKTVKV